jgi:hypothetical protein
MRHVTSASAPSSATGTSFIAATLGPTSAKSAAVSSTSCVPE